MRVALFEDNDEKFKDIAQCLLDRGVAKNSLERVRTLAEFARLDAESLDLIIVDLRMPGVDGGESRDAGAEILSMLDYSGLRSRPVMAITAFASEAESSRETFESRGCIVFDYYSRDVWQKALDVYIAQSRDRGRYDFIIFTALKKERDAFLSIDGVEVQSTVRNGIDIWELSLGAASGAVVLLPGMGLVNATAMVAKVLENFSPRVVAMSGICAGVRKGVEMGSLLVAEMCWEYQSGKWSNDTFEAEPYQSRIPESTRVLLSKILESPSLIDDLELGFRGDHRPSKKSAPKMAVFTTGSAVIASKQRLDAVKQQHRRVSGLDMEVFGFLRAVELSAFKGDAFAAKVVVDRGDAKKDDAYHEYGCFLSAKFCIETVLTVLGTE